MQVAASARILGHARSCGGTLNTLDPIPLLGEGVGRKRHALRCACLVQASPIDSSTRNPLFRQLGEPALGQALAREAPATFIAHRLGVRLVPADKTSAA